MIHSSFVPFFFTVNNNINIEEVKTIIYIYIYYIHTSSIAHVIFTLESESNMAMSNIKSDGKVYKIVLVGDSLSGKSALVISFVRNQFNSDTTSNFDEISHTKTIKIDNKTRRTYISSSCNNCLKNLFIDRVDYFRYIWSRNF